MELRGPERLIDLSSPAIMGILNVTPDSFSDGGRFLSSEKAFARAREMVSEGAEIIDVGGESTRPGASSVGPHEELDRILPVITRIKQNLEVLVSVDTSKEIVARTAVKQGGADLVNDISALQFDPRMAATVAELKVPVVLMHIKGVPRTMQTNPHYDNVVEEVCAYFQERIDFARSRGIESQRIILDPGIGFGKRVVDNVDLLRHLGRFRQFGCPLLVGTSRKSFLGKLGGQAVAEERLSETITANAVAVLNGADILRVHDVAETARSMKVLKQLADLS